MIVLQEEKKIEDIEMNNWEKTLYYELLIDCYKMGTFILYKVKVYTSSHLPSA